MLRRIAALTVFAAISLVGVSAVFAWYQQLQSVPTMSNYTIPCEQDATAAWCGSLQRIFSSGAVLLGACAVAAGAPTMARSRRSDYRGTRRNGSALGLAAGAGGVLQPLAVPRPLSCGVFHGSYAHLQCHDPVERKETPAAGNSALPSGITFGPASGHKTSSSYFFRIAVPSPLWRSS